MLTNLESRSNLLHHWPLFWKCRSKIKRTLALPLLQPNVNIFTIGTHFENIGNTNKHLIIKHVSEFCTCISYETSTGVIFLPCFRTFISAKQAYYYYQYFCIFLKYYFNVILIKTLLSKRVDYKTMTDHASLRRQKYVSRIQYLGE